MILSKKANNKGTDQNARMRRLVCTCVVRNPLKTGFLAVRPICDFKSEGRLKHLSQMPHVNGVLPLETEVLLLSLV